MWLHMYNVHHEPKSFSYNEAINGLVITCKAHFKARLQGLPLRFETQTWSICLFESHSVQPNEKQYQGSTKNNINFFQVLNAPFYSYMYCQAHVISARSQKIFMFTGL